MNEKKSEIYNATDYKMYQEVAPLPKPQLSISSAIANWAVPFIGWGGRYTGHEKQLISSNFGDTIINETTIFILIAYSYLSKCNNIIFLWHFLSISMLEAMNGAPARWMVPYAQRVLCVQGAAGLVSTVNSGHDGVLYVYIWGSEHCFIN